VSSRISTPLGHTVDVSHDIVILCTGFNSSRDAILPILTSDLLRRVNDTSSSQIDSLAQFQVMGRKLFIQAMRGDAHGPADANFTTAPAKNAAIVNELAGQCIYELRSDDLLAPLASIA
jgi:lysine/ornithine N-monooxygenase